MNRLASTVGTAFVAAALFLAPAPAATQGLGLETSVDVTAVSDYRLRGVSQTANTWAMQIGFTASHASGVYGGTWGSSIGEIDAGDQEIDFFLGWGKEFGSIGVDAGLTTYMYPGFDTEFVEMYASASTAMGIVGVAAGAAWAPSQADIGSQSNQYFWASVGAPAGPVELAVTAGLEDGAFGAIDGARQHIDFGAGWAYERFSVGANYIFTDDDTPITQSGFVATFGVSF